jgi:glucose/arabinose dehydrogenase
MRSQARVLLLVLGALPFSGCGGDGSPAGPTPSPSPTSVSCPSGAPVSGIPALQARLVVSGLRAPLDLQSVPGDGERLYVVEQGGRIRVVRNGQIAGTFLDITGRLSSGGERGLLGLVFHPQFATNRRFFVNYTNPAGDTHISEFRASSADAADPASERVLLEVGQPFANHNGGGLAFDNPGRLLIALGDGGSGGDPLNNGQKLSTLLGKILRIDVDAGSPYGVPADNPFRATAGARAEIWAYGLRNPFRIAIDRPTGDLYIGDVGQNAVEEIDVDPGSRRGGLNYGWRITEGSRCFNPSSGCDTSGITMPIYEYSHGDGCSVTGGVVYRGCRVPALAGTYFFADYCSAFVRSLRFASGQATEFRDWTSGLRGIESPTSFGLDAAGELYVVDQDGEIYRLEPS